MLPEILTFDPGPEPYQSGMPHQDVYELTVLARVFSTSGVTQRAGRAMFTSLPGVMAAQAAVFENTQATPETAMVLLAAIATHGLPRIPTVTDAFRGGEERLEFTGIALLKKLLPTWANAEGEIKIRRGRLYDPKEPING